MSRRAWGWWQQLQSGEYRKTKLKNADSSWVSWTIGLPTNATPSPKTSSLRKTQPPLQKNLPKHRYVPESLTLAKSKNQLKRPRPAAMKEPQITIAKIQEMLNHGHEATKLYELLSSALDILKGVYKTSKSLFSDNDIVLLKHARNINNLLIMLIKTKEELVQQIVQFRKQYPKS